MNLALHFLLELYKINDFMWYENAVYCSFTVRWFILTRQSLIKMSDRSFNCFLFAVRRRKLCFFVAVSCARSKHLSPAGYYVVNYKDTLCSFVEALFIFAFSVAHFVSAWGLTNMSNASPSSENTCRAPFKKKKRWRPSSKWLEKCSDALNFSCWWRFWCLVFLLCRFQADDAGGLLHVSGGDDSLRCYAQPGSPLGGLHHRWSARVILSFIHCFFFVLFCFLAG